MDSLSLQSVADEELEAARAGSSSRSARTIHGGRDRALRETVIALVAGHGLAEHESPGEATLQVLRGRVRLTAGEDVWESGVGGHAVVPAGRHALAALEDAVVLLTVLKPVP